MKEEKRKNGVLEGEEKNDENIIVVRNLKKYFPRRSTFLKRIIGSVKAVDDVSFKIRKGTTMGLVGESGCGKSTLSRTILRLQDKTEGEVYFKGREIFSLSKEELRKKRPEFQLIFQDPYSSLSPHLTVGKIISEAVREHHIVQDDEIDDYITQIMARCGLAEYMKTRYPHEFSGGQRQRISIARALALKPDFVVCDEPVSALDVSIQAQILNLLRDLQRRDGLTYLFVSHDLSLVEYISDTVGVMYLGKLVEYALTEELFLHPLHPYTELLLSSIPVTDPDFSDSKIILGGSPGSFLNPPSGCLFHPRCPRCMKICSAVSPELRKTGEGHYVACHLFTSDERSGNQSL